MVQFNDFLITLDGYLSGSWWFPILLVGTGIFFTVYLGFPQFKFFGKAWNLVSGKNQKDDAEGETSGFEALTTAMSGAVGTGNIGGVALAIWTGGPAAIFWMWITAIFGMTTKFVEVTMGHKYRTKLDDGSISGGPMYYIEHALNMKWAGILFAFLMMITAIGSGNMPQINNIALVMSTEFSVPKIFTGLFLGALLWIIIIGGIKRIASVTEKIVPFMALLYIVACLYILLLNFSFLDDAIALIVKEAFNPTAIGVGGVIGVLMVGFKRAAFSNEAGVGSASIAHSAVKTKYAASEGLVALLEPFIDTVVICTLTALVIITFNSSGVFAYGGEGGVMIDGVMYEGAGITSKAFAEYIPYSDVFLTVAVVLFAVSTMISWSYYGLQSWKFLFGRGEKSDLTYKLLFLSFVIIGSAASMNSIWAFSDAMIFAMVFPNMIGLYILFPVVKEQLTKYLNAIKN